jgi:hypothetical protein
MTTKTPPGLILDGSPGDILQYNQDGVLEAVPLASASLDLDTLGVVQNFADTDLFLVSVGGVESAITGLDLRIALDAITVPTPPIGAGELVQYSDPTQYIAPTNTQVKAYEIQLQDAASVRLQFRLRDVGSNPQWRDSQALLRINGVSQGVIADAGTANDIIANYDVLGLNPGDILAIYVRVQNADQSPYIDAYISDFFVKTDAPLPNPIIQLQ